MFALAAVFDQGAQLMAVFIGQALYGGDFEHVAAEGPAQAQLTGVDLAIERQPVTQWRVQALLIAFGVCAGHQQRLLIGCQVAIQLAQIVEGDARHRQGTQALTAGSVCQVAQHTIANALFGHGAQLFLDLLDRPIQRCCRAQPQREQAGEPADRAAQVEVVEQRFAPVPFQLDQGRGFAAPAADYPRKRSQQQVVDLGTISGRGLLQQLSGQRPVQVAVDRVGVPVAQGASAVVLRQAAAGMAQLRLPIAQFGLQRVAAGVGLQLFGPGPEGTGLGGQLWHLPGRTLLVGPVQVLQQNTPGHSIDDQMVDRQQQALTAVRQGCQHRAQHRPIGQVEAALGLGAQCLQLTGIGQCRAP
ncbi:hypothetical protein D3C80_778530 [compost metagenome]